MSDFISSIDNINKLMKKYDVMNMNQEGAAPMAEAAAPENAFGADGNKFSKEAQGMNNLGAQQNQMPKAGSGEGAMWAMFGVNLGMSILDKVLGLFGKGGGGCGEEGGDDQNCAGGGG